MQILMKYPNPVGWAHATPETIEMMEKAGWVRSNEKERQDMIAAKHSSTKEAAADKAADNLADVVDPVVPQRNSANTLHKPVKL